MEKKRFRLTYNGVVSEFNATPNGQGGIMVGKDYVSKSISYAVRPSKTNTIGVTRLIVTKESDGTTRYSCNATTKVKRGLEPMVQEITENTISKRSKAL